MDTVPRVPEGEPEAERKGPGEPRDAGVVVKPPAVALPACAVHGEMAPLCPRELAPFGVRGAQVRFDLVERGHARGRFQAMRDRLQRVERYERADVVHHQASHGAQRARRGEHAQEAAHRGADPVDAARADVREERGDVGEELPEVVLERRGEPVAFAAPRKVEAEDARVGCQALRERVEVARVAAIAVRADDDVRVGTRAPFDIVQPVEARRTERGERAVAWPDARDRARRTRFESTVERMRAARAVHAALHQRADQPQGAHARGDTAGDQVADRDRALDPRPADVLLDRFIVGVFTLVIHLKPPCGRFMRSPRRPG